MSGVILIKKVFDLGTKELIVLSNGSEMLIGFVTSAILRGAFL